MKRVGRVLRIWYVGGGTGGHIFPLFAVEQEVRALCGVRGIPYRGQLVTGRSRRERSWVCECGIQTRHIHGGKLRRYRSLRNITDLALIAAGFFESLILLITSRPDVIFSKGGYISVPPLLLARLFSVRIVLHESDLSFGLANRLCAPHASTLCVNLPQTLETLSSSLRKKAVVTGLPSRIGHEVENPPDVYKRFSLDPGKPVVTVIGGSLGAMRINELVPELYDMLQPEIQIVHQCGVGRMETGPFSGQKRPGTGYVRVPFLTDEYAALLKSSVCVISRAGASAIADFLALQVPMLLIPLPLSASRGDQIENAGLYEQAGCASVFDNDTVSAASLAQAVRILVENPSARGRIQERMKELYRPDAAHAIAQILVDGNSR